MGPKGDYVPDHHQMDDHSGSFNRSEGYSWNLEDTDINMSDSAEASGKKPQKDSSAFMDSEEEDILNKSMHDSCNIGGLDSDEDQDMEPNMEIGTEIITESIDQLLFYFFIF